LTRLTIPANIAQIGDRFGGVFRGVTTLECVNLVGGQLAPAVVEAVEPALAPGAQVVSPVLAGRKFGRFTIIAGS
jgi:hypothetical protein